MRQVFPFRFVTLMMEENRSGMQTTMEIESPKSASSSSARVRRWGIHSAWSRCEGHERSNCYVTGMFYIER